MRSTLTQNDLVQIRGVVKTEVKAQIKSELKHLPTKNEFYEKMDEVMGEIKVIREEKEAMSGQI